MQENPESLLLTDDTAARLAAITLGYRVHGTVGILVRAIRRKQRKKDEILSVLRRIPTASTLHIHSALLEEIISQVDRSQIGIEEYSESLEGAIYEQFSEVNTKSNLVISH